MVLKYTENFSRAKSKFSSGLYIVIACCLLIIGGASWFALSKFEEGGSTPPIENTSEYKDGPSSYIENTSDNPSDTEQTPETPPAEATADNVSKEPYNSTVSENVSKPKPVTYAFTMPVQGEIIKEYSDSVLQYSSTYGDMRLHNGIDIACEEGTSVSTCAKGTVTAIEQATSFGDTVIIDHGNGVSVKYSALKDIKVKQGDSVEVGDIIGVSATVPAECNDKDHIHIEVIKNGIPASPLDVLGLK